LADEWIKKMRYMYTMEFYSATKSEIMSFTRKMGGTGDHHVK
jgi:hypothetical protein